MVEKDNNKVVERESTMLEYIYENMDVIFQEYIPMESIKELPGTYLYAFGLIAEGFMLGLFLYFVITSYQSGVSQQFVSLQTSPYCSTVSKPFSGTYLASDQGLWQGSAGFNFNQALYSFDFSAFAVSTAGFASFMDSVKQELEFLGAFASNQNIAMNLVILMTTIFEFTSSGKLQTVSFSGNPSIVFNRAYIYSTISSPAGNCEAFSSTIFNVYTATYSISYEHNMYEQLCREIAEPSDLGYYSPTAAQDEFIMNIDMTALTTALSINLGFNANNKIEYVQPSSVLDPSIFYFEYRGIEYKVQQLFDTRYPGMTPLVCLVYVETEDIFICTLPIGNVFALPLLNHYGGVETNYDSPQYCNCSTEVGFSNQCNEFTLMPSLVFSNNGTYDYVENFYPLIDMVNNYTAIPNPNSKGFGMKPYYYLNEAAYLASFASLTNQIPYNNENVFSFCGFNCTMISIYAGDYFNQAVSSYYYQLSNASCGNPFNISDWAKFSEDPPAPLVEDYYSCVDSWYVSLFNALGISAGNTSIGVAFFSILLLPLIFLSLRATGYAPPYLEYSEVEKKRAVEELALQLLRARDGKTRGMKQPNGIIQKLSKQLVYAAERAGGYPDSDDEEDEEDDDQTRNSDNKNKAAGSSNTINSDNNNNNNNNSNISSSYNTDNSSKVRFVNSNKVSVSDANSISSSNSTNNKVVKATMADSDDSDSDSDEERVQKTARKSVIKKYPKLSHLPNRASSQFAKRRTSQGQNQTGRLSSLTSMSNPMNNQNNKNKNNSQPSSNFNINSNSRSNDVEMGTIQR